MEEPLLTVLKLSSVIALIFANAFFVAAEFALVSIRRTRVEELINAGIGTARVVKQVTHDPDRFIAATQLGITIASLGLGWIGEPAVARLIEPLFAFLPPALVGPAVHSVAASAIAFTIITFLHVVIGELAPKSVALAYPEQTSLFVARPTVIFENIFRPVIWALNGAGNGLLRLVGLHRPAGHQLVHSVEELKMLVSATAASGELEPREKAMLQNVFEFNDRLVREVMIPRPDMVVIAEHTTIDEFLQTFTQTTHSRFPIYARTIDNITGFIAIKDVLRAMAESADARQKPVRAFARPPMFVPESKRVGSLFAEMQTQKNQIAIVIDEFGGTAGMVTLEELLEEIVGRLGDELAGGGPVSEMVDEHSMQFDGQLRVAEVNEQLGIALTESADYQTIAGFVLYALHHIPKEGEQFRADNVRITVTSMEGPKIEKVLITRL
ncbi:MAG: HlyC/CorC family transporter [Chloroflexi bacterium]|nr:HlyC/CorC family transporter [Chloroflexota bacterium]